MEQTKYEYACLCLKSEKLAGELNELKKKYMAEVDRGYQLSLELDHCAVIIEEHDKNIKHLEKERDRITDQYLRSVASASDGIRKIDELTNEIKGLKKWITELLTSSKVQ